MNFIHLKTFIAVLLILFTLTSGSSQKSFGLFGGVTVGKGFMYDWTAYEVREKVKVKPDYGLAIGFQATRNMFGFYFKSSLFQYKGNYGDSKITVLSGSFGPEFVYNKIKLKPYLGGGPIGSLFYLNRTEPYPYKGQTEENLGIEEHIGIRPKIGKVNLLAELGYELRLASLNSQYATQFHKLNLMLGLRWMINE